MSVLSACVVKYNLSFVRSLLQKHDSSQSLLCLYCLRVLLNITFPSFLVTETRQFGELAVSVLPACVVKYNLSFVRSLLQKHDSSESLLCLYCLRVLLNITFPSFLVTETRQFGELAVSVLPACVVKYNLSFVRSLLQKHDSSESLLCLYCLRVLLNITFPSFVPCYRNTTVRRACCVCTVCVCC